MKKLILIVAMIGSFFANGQTAKEYYANGSKLFLDGNYGEASKQYSKSLDLEKKNRTLDKPNYYVLIDNLGMSYAISGNIKEAIKTLEYGVSVDATYPMFYYILACCYGEQNNIDKVVYYLEYAIKYKKNMFDGEEFPNPKQDDSFKKFLDNDKFIKVVGQQLPEETIDNLKITDKEVPQEYSITKKANCISIQACTFYDSPDMYEMLIGKIKLKDIQNFESNKDKGSIMYFEFEDGFKGEGFLDGLLWGDDMKPTKKHPEQYFSKGKYLIIWSFNDDSQIKKISENKIKALLK